MLDDFALNRDINRAAQAQTLLDNDLMKEAFATLEADYIAAWRETSARDTDARERLWQALQLVGKVRGHLTAVVAGGRLAQAEMDQFRA
jgi:hypothetical protein